MEKGESRKSRESENKRQGDTEKVMPQCDHSMSISPTVSTIMSAIMSAVAPIGRRRKSRMGRRRKLEATEEMDTKTISCE